MSVFRFFENLSDPRAYNQKHHFLDIVFLVVSAVI
ncbi:putative transposase, partial [Glaesserella parasuis 12939]